MQIVARVMVHRSAEHTRPGFSLAPHRPELEEVTGFYQTPGKTQPQWRKAPVNDKLNGEGEGETAHVLVRDP